MFCFFDDPLAELAALAAAAWRSAARLAALLHQLTHLDGGDQRPKSAAPL
jgi:hypothetical protein